ncbi:MAG: histidine kinase internal region [Anaerocolumna sp.]|jgi:two-component system sensor histidine kinase YesM|nr:histidine kinase internal region [Anaerocolumna sp.]
MLKLIGNLKIRVKIIILCVTILILNSSVVGFLYYNYAFRDTLENTYSSSEDIIYQANNYFNDRLSAIVRRVYAMCNNQTFTLAMSTYLNNPKGEENYSKLLGIVADSLTELYQGDKYISSVYMYTKYGEFDDFSRIKRRDFVFEESEFYKSFENDHLKTVSWFPAMRDKIFTRNETVIPIAFRFLVVGSRENVYIVVNLQQSAFIKYFRESYGSVDMMFLTDNEGNNIANYGLEEKAIISNFNEEKLGNNKAVCDTVVHNDTEYLGTFTILKTNGWKLYSIKSKTDLLSNLNALRTFIIILLLLSIAISIIVIILFAYSITRPMNRLDMIMRKAIQQDFHVKFQYPYKNEVGNLADSFNYMIREIDDLVTELNINIEALKEEKDNVKNEQKQKRIAELKALQAQINPHFLYNTLNAITWQAADQGASEISILANSLGKFFRLSLSKGNEIITLKDEIEHVRSYLNIQRIRYKSKLNYDIEVDQELLLVPTIKLILQPLVENAIYHGIKLKEAEGLIRIYFSKHVSENGISVIKMCVEDDGYGIEEEKLEIINNSLIEGKMNKEEGYGIFNINERIKLYYGDAYGLMLESKFGEWTRATIIIPTQIMEVD